MTRWILLPIALGLVVWFTQSLRRFLTDRKGLSRDRAVALDACLALLDGARVVMEPSGFPRLTGLRGGHPFEIRLIPDSLTFRKRPALWLQVTAPQTMAGEARIMARGSGLEPFSTFQSLPLSMALPAGFPETCALRLSDASALPGPALMADLARDFADPALKEVALGAKGLRQVRLQEEADRVPYLIYREQALGRKAVAPAILAAMMDRLIALSGELKD